jgi:undecaprenyl-phosphate galactose phosphotransferase
MGIWLRRTSLDELPQLINVIRGEMSLVGPRPVVADELERYGDNLFYYVESKPGLTGLWQVSGRSDVTYRQRVHLDSWYVRNWSLWCDLVILVKTPKAVLRGFGAY